MFKCALFHKGLAMQTITTPVARTPIPGLATFDVGHPVDMTRQVSDATGLAMDVLGLPFDIARAQYARAVQAGLIERSMLASRDFSRTMGALEQLTLGPWARHV
jgi:hypothetical protein